ncbi:DUF563 domain-containing protein [Paenibacillus chartarius]|uniref:DUF563 domain-containing protein n=1 Tax=Paenibacillus chartarius TaxID=747481 RepID=A0ABV6DMX9_9BACL
MKTVRLRTKRTLAKTRSQQSSGRTAGAASSVSKGFAGARSSWTIRPQGLYTATKKYLIARYGKTRYTRYYKVHHSGDVTKLSDSKGLDAQPPKHFRSTTFQASPCFTALIPNARVWEKNGAVITPDNKLLSDVSWDYRKGLVHGSKHNVFKVWEPHRLKTYSGTAALLTFIWSGNYFHWMFDVLPRIELIRRSRVTVDKYIVPNDRSSFQNETLNLLGIPPAKRILTDHDFHARFERLLVPSFVRPVSPHPSTYPKWTVSFLRKELLEKRNITASDEYERIYISRSKARQRRVLNEEELHGILYDYGLRIVHLEGKSVQEQMQILHSAKVVVGPHGAGLTNLVFSKPGTKVVEMFSPDYVSNYYWHLSNQIGLEHYYYIGVNNVKPHKDWWSGSSDFEVEPRKLERLLRIANI